jgi:hypothetical protein
MPPLDSAYSSKRWNQGSNLAKSSENSYHRVFPSTSPHNDRHMVRMGENQDSNATNNIKNGVL